MGRISRLVVYHTSATAHKRRTIGHTTGPPAIDIIMFDADALTIQQEISANSSVNLVTGTSVKYILNVSIMEKENDSQSQILCGTSVVAETLKGDLPQVLMNYRCANNIIAKKIDGANKPVSFIMTYVDRDVTATPSAQNLALVQSVAYDVPTREAFYGFGLLFFTFMAIAILYMSINLGLYIYKK